MWNRIIRNYFMLEFFKKSAEIMIFFDSDYNYITTNNTYYFTLDSLNIF